MVRFRQLALAAVLCAAASSALADYKRSYATGLEAAQAGRWDEAEARMKEALAEEATPKANVKLYGMRFETYVPQYYLGLAAKNRGDCATALKYWDSPGVESVVQGDNKLSGAASAARSDCRGKVASAPPPTTPTTVATTTPETPTKVDTKPPPPPGPSNPPPSQNPPTQNPTTVASNNPPPTQVKPPPPAPPVAPTVEPVNAPADLVSAIDNYLGGRYAQAASVDPAKLADPRARYHALLVRAAARFVQAQLQSGDGGKTLLSQAETDVRGAKQLQPNAAPDATLFPPKFRQFYTATR